MTQAKGGYTAALDAFGSPVTVGDIVIVYWGGAERCFLPVAVKSIKGRRHQITPLKIAYPAKPTKLNRQTRRWEPQDWTVKTGDRQASAVILATDAQLDKFHDEDYINRLRGVAAKLKG